MKITFILLLFSVLSVLFYLTFNFLLQNNSLVIVQPSIIIYHVLIFYLKKIHIWKANLITFEKIYNMLHVSISIIKILRKEIDNNETGK